MQAAVELDIVYTRIHNNHFPTQIQEAKGYVFRRYNFLLCPNATYSFRSWLSQSSLRLGLPTIFIAPTARACFPFVRGSKIPLRIRSGSWLPVPNAGLLRFTFPRMDSSAFFGEIRFDPVIVIRGSISSP